MFSISKNNKTGMQPESLSIRTCVTVLCQKLNRNGWCCLEAKLSYLASFPSFSQRKLTAQSILLLKCSCALRKKKNGLTDRKYFDCDRRLHLIQMNNLSLKNSFLHSRIVENVLSVKWIETVFNILLFY